MTPAPLEFAWDGESMIPRHPRRADQLYVVGERYWLEPHEPRSMRSHGHFFACVHEAWANLPEDLAEQYPTADHLRKRALIKAGYRNERSFVCASRAEALRFLTFLKATDNMAFYVVHECTVIEYTAKSQSMRAMGKRDFQASKDAVLDVLAELIGTPVGDLRQNAGKAA